MNSHSEAGSRARAATLADDIEQARRADPPGTGTKLEITHADWDAVMVPALRAFAASATPANAREVAEKCAEIAELFSRDGAGREVARRIRTFRDTLPEAPQPATARSEVWFVENDSSEWWTGGTRHFCTDPAYWTRDPHHAAQYKTKNAAEEVSDYLRRYGVDCKATGHIFLDMPAPSEKLQQWPIERLEDLRQQHLGNIGSHAAKQAYINGLEFELRAALSATGAIPGDEEIAALFRKRDALENPLSADEVDEQIDQLLRKQFGKRRAADKTVGREGQG